MPLFAVICRDKPGQLQTRLDTRDAHLAFLKSTDALRMAGPLLEEGEMRGSLLVVEFDDLASAQGWAAGDPYKAAGLFQSAEVIEWKKVIG
ncbi:hypothetical protein SAMN06265221_111106 [Paracoccus laeviglucosivorans]|uniref:YCII-related domain-containing protein n=2 Tax=Paracoccus laeviglucosivorans TaxID=1197861 RepID=A0A521E6G7_9RHOB|nr:hypothetical protein SAMN06265221_111106 [Paracoccus laeviglucosivorans]